MSRVRANGGVPPPKLWTISCFFFCFTSTYFPHMLDGIYNVDFSFQRIVNLEL